MDGRETGVVGREPLLARLAELWSLAGPDAVVLVGHPGMGKTTLWEAAIRAGAGRRRVLSARPAEAEAPLSFSALIDLFAGVGDDELSDLPAPQRRALEAALLRTDPPEGGTALPVIHVGVLGALRALAAREPLLVAVDDVQWLDPPSAATLAFAARRTEGRGIRFLLARRPGVASPVGACARTPGAGAARGRPPQRRRHPPPARRAPRTAAGPPPPEADRRRHAGKPALRARARAGLGRGGPAGRGRRDPGPRRGRGPARPPGRGATALDAPRASRPSPSTATFAPTSSTPGRTSGPRRGGRRRHCRGGWRSRAGVTSAAPGRGARTRSQRRERQELHLALSRLSEGRRAASPSTSPWPPTHPTSTSLPPWPRPLRAPRPEGPCWRPPSSASMRCGSPRRPPRRGSSGFCGCAPSSRRRGNASGWWSCSSRSSTPSPEASPMAGRACSCRAP